MSANALPEADLAALARQVDGQLTALQAQPVRLFQLRGDPAGPPTGLPAARDQQAVIEAVCEGCAEEEAARENARKQAAPDEPDPH